MDLYIVTSMVVSYYEKRVGRFEYVGISQGHI